MANFLKDKTALPNTKYNIKNVPITENPDNWITASDFNTHKNALKDIQDALSPGNDGYILISNSSMDNGMAWVSQLSSISIDTVNGIDDNQLTIQGQQVLVKSIGGNGHFVRTDTSETITIGNAIFSNYNNGTLMAYVDSGGAYYSANGYFDKFGTVGAINIGTGNANVITIGSETNNNLWLKAKAPSLYGVDTANGGYPFTDTKNVYTSGAPIFGVKNNGGVKAYVAHDGSLFTDSGTIDRMSVGNVSMFGKGDTIIIGSTTYTNAIYLEAKTPVLYGTDVANGGCPYTNTVNTFTGNYDIFSVWNAGVKKASVNSSGFIKTYATTDLNTYNKVAPTLTNSWANLGSGYRNAFYWKDIQGIVHLEGTITGGDDGASAFTLPTGYRASGYRKFIVPAGGSATAQITIYGGGGVLVKYLGTPGPVSLDGIYFTAEV